MLHLFDHNELPIILMVIDYIRPLCQCFNCWIRRGN